MVKTDEPAVPDSGDPIYRVRFSNALVAKIDDWAAAGGLGRSDAIRHLIELGLRGSKWPLASPGRNQRASEMAGTEIDRHEDASASSSEQKSRKLRLLEGPEEFLEDRVDRPKDA